MYISVELSFIVKYFFKKKLLHPLGKIMISRLECFLWLKKNIKTNIPTERTVSEETR